MSVANCAVTLICGATAGFRFFDSFDPPDPLDPAGTACGGATAAMLAAIVACVVISTTTEPGASDFEDFLSGDLDVPEVERSLCSPFPAVEPLVGAAGKADCRLAAIAAVVAPLEAVASVFADGVPGPEILLNLGAASLVAPVA